MGTSRTQKADIGDKIQYLVRDFNDNTIRFVVRYPGRVASDVLRDATKAVVESTDILHASFMVGESDAYWMIYDDYEEKDYFQIIDTEEDPLEVANTYALVSMQAKDKTKLRCYLVRGSKENVLVLLISHLCVDGMDGKYLLGKIVEAYNSILEHGTADITVKNGRRDAAQIYDNISKKDYRSLMKNPISKIKSEFPYPTKEAGRPHLIQVNISQETMKKVHGRLELKEITLNDLLITSCYYAYASMPDKKQGEPMSILSMIDLRRHCIGGDSEGLSNMTGAMPTTLPIGLRENFSVTLEKIVAQTQAIKEDPLAGLEGMPLLHGAAKNLPMKMLLPIASKLYGSFSIGLTNLGNIENAFLSLGGMEPDFGLFGAPMKKKPGMQISVVSIGGNCTLCVVGECTDEDARLLQVMLKRMAEEIENYALF
ncbi:condensation domain-containing protein [Pradoshia sp.]